MYSSSCHSFWGALKISLKNGVKIVQCNYWQKASLFISIDSQSAYILCCIHTWAEHFWRFATPRNSTFLQSVSYQHFLTLLGSIFLDFFMSLSLQLLYSAASLERKECSSLETGGFWVRLSPPKVSCHFPEFTRSFMNNGISLPLKWTNLFARAPRLSMALALIISWVLSSHSL